MPRQRRNLRPPPKGDARALTPVTYVVPPLPASLDKIQALVAAEVGYMAEDQLNGERMGSGTAKTLSLLTDALVKAQAAKRMLTEDELRGLSDDELIASLRAELAEAEAKKLAKENPK